MFQFVSAAMNAGGETRVEGRENRVEKWRREVNDGDEGGGVERRGARGREIRWKGGKRKWRRKWRLRKMMEAREEEWSQEVLRGGQ